MNLQPQPYVIQQSSKITPGQILTGAAVIGVAGYFGLKAYKSYRADKEAENLDDPASQIASKIYNAKNWYGDKEQVAYDAAREIASQKIPWKDVAKAFKAAGHGNIDEYLTFLGPEEKAQFFNIINLAKPSDPGKPPALSSLKYDDVKNTNFAVAKVGTRIRKTPEVVGDGGIIDIKSNIVATVQPGTKLGLMTGEYKLSPDGKTGFIEFWATLMDGKKVMKLQRVWVAGANINIVAFDRKTQAVLKETYIKNSTFLKIDWATYFLNKGGTLTLIN